MQSKDKKNDNVDDIDYVSGDEDDGPTNNQQEGNQGQGMAIISFKDLMLKVELLRAVESAGFEKPSPIQQEGIKYANQGRDILCQAKAGTGKTAVFALSILQQLQPDSDRFSALIICHNRELAYQIRKEFDRLGRFLTFKIEDIFGGVDINEQIKKLKENKPHVIVATPGRLRELISRGELNFTKLKFFVIDECDKVLDNLNMRNDVQEIFQKYLPQKKQVMMFSGTLSEENKKTARKFMDNPQEIVVEDNADLVLHGLDQFQKNITEKKKLQELCLILKSFQFNQAIIFVNKVERAIMLGKVVSEYGFQSVVIHRNLDQKERIQLYDRFKQNSVRILVATDVWGRGIDIDKVNMVINFDMPLDDHTYMHRVGRAGRFETKGIAISFVADNQEKETLDIIQKKFKYEIKELPSDAYNIK